MLILHFIDLVYWVLATEATSSLSLPCYCFEIIDYAYSAYCFDFTDLFDWILSTKATSELSLLSYCFEIIISNISGQ